MAERNQVDTRVRLSAEGQEEVIAAFRQVEREAQRSGKQAGNAFTTLGQQARKNLTDIGALVRGFGILEIANQLQRVLPLVAKFIDSLRGIEEGAQEAVKAQLALNKALAETKTVQDAAQRQKQLAEELRQHEKVLQSLTVTWLPDWANAAIAAAGGQREAFVHARDRVAELRGQVQEAANDYFKLRDAAQKAADAMIAGLQSEVLLLGKTETERIQILHLLQLAKVAQLRDQGQLSQAQVNELVNLLNTKRAHELNTLAVKRQGEALRGMGIELVKVGKALGEFQRERPTLLRPGESREITSTAEAFERLAAAVGQFREESTGITVETFAEDAKRLLKAPEALVRTAPTPIFTELDPSRVAIFERAQQTLEGLANAGDLFVQRAQQLRLEFDAGALTTAQYEEAIRKLTEEFRGGAAQASQFDQVMQQLEQTLSSDALKTDVVLGVHGAFTEFFTSGIQNAKSFGDAMRQLALGIVQALQRVAAQALATFLVTRLLGGLFGGLFGGLGSFSTGGLVRTPPFVPEGKAAGGLIHGPGTGTSDSIPAWLSAGEYVVREAVVKQPGVLDWLHDLNAGRLRLREPRMGFADGGLVESLNGMDFEGGRGGDGANGRMDVTLGLTEGLVVQAFEASSAVDRVMIRKLERNRKAVNAALGHNAI